MPIHADLQPSQHLESENQPQGNPNDSTCSISSLDAALAALGSAPHVPLSQYDDHATDALLAAAWLRHAAGDPALWTTPALDSALARTEGWTFGIP